MSRWTVKKEVEFCQGVFRDPEKYIGQALVDGFSLDEIVEMMEDFVFLEGYGLRTR